MMMRRSGYSDDYGDDEPWQLIMWRGAVASAFRGRRGQAFLREMVAALDAMPIKELAADSLRYADGSVCALGAVAAARGVNVQSLDPYDTEAVAATFGVAQAMVREIVYENDENCWGKESPAARWARMRTWAEGQIRNAANHSAESVGRRNE
jgi:hypothetical protein